MDDINNRFQNLHELVKVARHNLDRNNWDYVMGGAETETTVARNRLALDSIAFRPRVLRDVKTVDCSTTLFGRRLRIPVALAPVGSLQRIGAEGAGAAAEATGAFGCAMFQSSVTEPPLEETAKRAPDAFKIYQLYVRGDEAWVDEQLRRAVDAGFAAFCFTVDTAHYSRRERDIAKRHVRWTTRNPNESEYQSALDWKHIERFKKHCKLPVIIKGIATAEDAKIALDHGVECIYVSNHGGRQLDHGRGSMDVLPEIAVTVAGRARIVIDGGFLRGTDIIKAVALGADAVAVGRLYCYALAAAGRAGIVRMLELLEDEIRRSLGLLGVTSFKELDASYVHAAAPVRPADALSAFNLLDLPVERY